MNSNKTLSLIALVTLSTVVVSLESHAQTTEQKIALCRTEMDLTKRITCLEAMLRGETYTSSHLNQPTSINLQPTPPIVASSPVAEPIELGQEQVANRENANRFGKRDDGRQSFTVLTTRQVPIRKLEVTLANGQVWRQIRGDTSNIRVSERYKDSLTVDIWQASISGYRMRLNEMRKTIRVERIR